MGYQYYSYERGVPAVKYMAEEIDRLYKDLVNEYDNIERQMALGAGNIEVDYKLNTASGPFTTTVSKFSLHYYALAGWSGVHQEAGDYLDGRFALLAPVTTHLFDYNNQVYDFCETIGVLSNETVDGRGLSKDGLLINGENPGYNIVSNIINSLSPIMVSKKQLVGIMLDRIRKYNIDLIDYNISVQNTTKDKIKKHLKKEVAKLNDNISASRVTILNYQYESLFDSYIENNKKLKTRLENFSWYDLLGTVDYHLPKFVSFSSTVPFSGNVELLNSTYNICSMINESLVVPSTNLLRLDVDSYLKYGLSNSGVSDIISDLDKNVYGVKNNFSILINGLGVAVQQISSLDNYDAIANEVIRGKWGNGAERKAKLEAAGYNYDEIQSRVNKILLGTGATITTGTSSIVSNISNNNSNNNNNSQRPTTQYRVQDTTDNVGLATSRKEYLEKLEKAQKDAEIKVAKLKEQQQKELENLRKQQDEKINKLKEQQAKELEKLREQQKQQALSDSQKQQEIDKLKQEQAKELEKLRQEQAKELEKLRQEQAKEAEKLKQQQAIDLEKIKQDSLNEIAKLKQNAQNNNFIPNANVSSSNNSSNAIINDSTIESSDMGDSILDNNNNDSIFNVEEPSYITPKPNRVVQTSDKSGNAGVVGSVLGIGALGAAGIVGARYVKKKKENETYSDDENYFSDDEEFSEVKEEETEKSSSKYKAGSVNSLVLDDSSEIDTTNSNITNSDVLDFE